MNCEACGTKLPLQTSGRPRKFCAPVNGVHECRDLASAISRLERALKPVNARLAAGDASDKLNLVELRYRLFTLLADEVTRPRHAPGSTDSDGNAMGGRFIKRRM